MGGWYSKILSSLFGEKDIRILILGLDGAGKTTILYRLSIGEVVDTVPTIGFNVETVSYKNLTFNVWDLGGQSTIRPYWRCYYADTGAVIYVVDAADVDRVGIAGDELGAMLGEEELKDVPLLVFANKQDQDGALAAQDVATRLGLHLLKDRDWRIVGCSAVKGEGLNEGLDWLVNVMKRGSA